MPRNGSGQYNPLTNTWNPPVTGVLATGADFQAQLNDISAAITQSVSKDGQTPMTANLPMGNNSIVGIASGTETSPSISANGDTNTGLYFPAADTIGVAVGGVNVGNFTSAGFSGNAATATNATNATNLVNGNATLTAGTAAAPSLTTTGDANTGLYFPAADTIGVAIGGVQVAQISQSGFSVNGNNISAVNSLGFRNRIINGDMRIDQRNNGASINPTDGQFVVDRFAMGVSQTSKLTAQRSAVAPVGFANSILVTSSSVYSVLAGDYFAVNQSVEGFNVADLGWGTANAQAVTLSFWVRSSLTGTFAGSLRNSASNRSYPFSYTISAANTWEQKTVTIAGDTAGTWLTDNGAGIRVWFTLGAGSTYSGTAGAWAAGNFVSATGATSVVGTSGATFYITGVQLEAGTVATPFERRDYGRELIMCQRYFYLFGPTPAEGAADGRLLVNPISGQQARLALPLVPVEMRTTPTPLFYTRGAVSGSLSEFSSGTSFSVTSTSSMATNGGGWAQLGATLSYSVAFRATYSAEL